jgi:REP element-mobilizing transposase RayT
VTIENQSYAKWDCKYHIVFIPKYRKKVLYGQIKKNLKEVFHRLAHQKGGVIESGELVNDHVHMAIEFSYAKSLRVNNPVAKNCCPNFVPGCL